MIRFITLFALSVLLLSCGKSQTTQQLSAQNAFFEMVSALCGQTFLGKGTYPEDESHEMIGVEIRLIIESCTESELRMPLHVGADKSRTWIITKTDKGLLLKHDHRYPDGRPHRLTNYGGFANDEGSAYRQYFEADQDTEALLPEAATNVWMMDINLADQVFTYYLERHQAPRYRAEIDLSKPVTN